VMDGMGIGPTLGPIVGEFIFYAFLVCTKLIAISSLVFYSLGRVRPSLYLWICWGTEYFIFQIFVPSGYYVCGVLLDEFLSIIWDVTKNLKDNEKRKKIIKLFLLFYI